LKQEFAKDNPYNSQARICNRYLSGYYIAAWTRRTPKPANRNPKNTVWMTNETINLKGAQPTISVTLKEPSWAPDFWPTRAPAILFY
jgi:hypothetical protein